MTSREPSVEDVDESQSGLTSIINRRETQNTLTASQEAARQRIYRLDEALRSHGQGAAQIKIGDTEIVVPADELAAFLAHRVMRSRDTLADSNRVAQSQDERAVSSDRPYPEPV